MRWFLTGILGGASLRLLLTSQHRYYQQQQQQQASSPFPTNNNNNNNNFAFCAATDADDHDPDDGDDRILNPSERLAMKKKRKSDQQQHHQHGVRCVIVGGGYAGCELAYKLDSVFDVTLIDEKNFLENRMEMVRVLCSPWAASNKKDPDDPKNKEASDVLAAASHFIHRVYLKRANVVTGSVEKVQFDPPQQSGAIKKNKQTTSMMLHEQKKKMKEKMMLQQQQEKEKAAQQQEEAQKDEVSSSNSSSHHQTDLLLKENPDKFVQLADGRRVPFDIIVFSTGEQQAFPFSTSQKTSDQRLAEVREFCNFMSHCHRVAVVGGGPMGTSVAGYLAAGRPDMAVELFNKHDTLLPKLPKNMRHMAEEQLANYKNLKINHQSVVEDVSVHVIDTRTTAAISDDDSKNGGGGGGGFLNSILGLFGAAGETSLGNLSTTTAASSPSLPSDKKAKIVDAAIDVTNQQMQDDNKKNRKDGFVDLSFDLKVRKYPTDDDDDDDNKTKTKRKKKKNPSVFVRAWMGDDFRGEMPVLDIEEKRREEAERQQNSTLLDEKGFDYVFVCTGGVPRSQLLTNSPELKGHIDSRGAIRVSKYFQLYGFPEAFAVGRCCSLPFTHSIGNSNLMSNTLFRALMTRFGENASSNQVMSKMSLDAHCISQQRMQVHRIVIPLGSQKNMIAASAWYGPTGGDNALKERRAEEALFREFKSPRFFKPQSPMKVRERFDKWSLTASTPVVDFTGMSEH